MTRVEFDPLAEIELSEAVAYYDAISVDLGSALIEETGRVVDQLVDFPLSVPIWKGELRRRPLFRFPYALVYVLEQDLIYIVAIFHHARDPKHIARRLSKLLRKHYKHI